MEVVDLRDEEWEAQTRLPSARDVRRTARRTHGVESVPANARHGEGEERKRRKGGTQERVGQISCGPRELAKKRTVGYGIQACTMISPSVRW